MSTRRLTGTVHKVHTTALAVHASENLPELNMFYVDDVLLMNARLDKISAGSQQRHRWLVSRTRTNSRTNRLRVSTVGVTKVARW